MVSRALNSICINLIVLSYRILTIILFGFSMDPWSLIRICLPKLSLITGYTDDRILLIDAKVITLHYGKQTNSGRAYPIPQVKLKNIQWMNTLPW